MDVLNLSAEFYRDPTIFAAECEFIFARSWQLIASENCLPKAGDYHATRIVGTDILLIRGADGQLRGFRNVCRHRGAKLLQQGQGNCAVIRCPYHDWHYDTAGRLVDTPWFGETSPFEFNRWPLLAIQVQCWRGLVFAALKPEIGLMEQLGDLPEELADAPLESFSVGATRHFDVPINWKTYVDQFVENYHVPPTHAPDKSAAIETFTSTPRRGMMIITAPVARSYGAKWLWGWPNWTLSLFQGGMKISRINPLSAGTIEVDFGFYFADLSESGEAARNRVIEATESIFREDSSACLRAQAGYFSDSYTPGPLHPRLEQSVAYFQSRVQEALQRRNQDTKATPQCKD
jgi:choline monooxygenase